MHQFWCWLGNNSSQLQAIGSVFAVIVAIALAVVAVRQAIAANAQAKAAEIQATAATAQVAAANRQIETSLIIGDTQTSPNISITPAMQHQAVVKETMAILNNGNGTATDVKLHYRDQSVGNEISLNNDVLVVRDSLPARFDDSRAAKSGFRLTYRTAFGTRYALDFDWHVSSSRPINLKLSVISREFPVFEFRKKT
jgi:hypothetical protein